MQFVIVYELHMRGLTHALISYERDLVCVCVKPLGFYNKLFGVNVRCV